MIAKKQKKFYVSPSIKQIELKQKAHLLQSSGQQKIPVEFP
jgi:hypothetical protein